MSPADNTLAIQLQKFMARYMKYVEYCC